ncbi:hypothetical protein J2810_001223 [Chryseobacterium rhizosphaerae]|nr:hypothetical protein [Chryseobacterium rhizosphaerae]
MNDQAYIDGEHNGGVYNSKNLSPYIYCYQNPVLLTDPNGKQAQAALLGGGPVGWVLFGIVTAGTAVYAYSEYDRAQENAAIVNRSIPKSPSKTEREVFPSNRIEEIKYKTFPKAEKDNLIVRTFPTNEKAKIFALSNLRPEKGYEGSGKHGLKWKEGGAEAKKTGIPQGQWGSQEDLDYAGQKASGLKPREGAEFELPTDTKSVVHMPDGTTKKATHIWIRNNGNEKTYHGYPKAKE